MIFMKTLSTPLFPFLEKHSENYFKKLHVQNSGELELGSFTEISLLLKRDPLLAPTETSVNIIMDYARQKLKQ